MGKRLFYNSNGLTLVEIMAAVAILSIVSIFVINITISSMDTNKQQSTESKQITDSSYILKLITKDLRSTSRITNDVVNEYIFFDDRPSPPIVTYIFIPENKSLVRNGSQIANNIENFTLTVSGHSVQIAFLLNGNNYRTDIVLRKGE